MNLTTQDLPAINAILNSIATVFLLIGWVQIRRGNTRNHAKAMIAAITVSAIFLVCYLVHKHYNGTTRFLEPDWVKPYYFFVLFTHLALSMLIVPLVGMTVYRAIKQQWDRHRRIARWTLPIWLYVSVTGVLVYFFLYQWFPQH